VPPCSFERVWGYENPLSGQFRRLEQKLDEWFGSGPTLYGTLDIRSPPAASSPAVNIAATPEAVTAYLFAPGMEAKQLDISLRAEPAVGVRQPAIAAQ
jgi:HSP20 family molecular chaperone IbpA